MRPGYVVSAVNCDEAYIAVIASKDPDSDVWQEEGPEEPVRRLLLYSATDLSLIYDRHDTTHGIYQIPPINSIRLSMGTKVLAALSYDNRDGDDGDDDFINVWRKDDGLLLYEQPIPNFGRDLLVHGNKIVVGDHARYDPDQDVYSLDQVQVSIYEYREGQVLGPRLMTVANNLSLITTTGVNIFIFFDNSSLFV